jgi:phenylalanyl-tRNA synthetase alpha chain
MHATITKQQLDAALALRDLSDQSQGSHAMQLVLAAITSALEHAWGSPVIEYRASPVVTVDENYTVLGYAPDATTRDARYTRYLDDKRLLRSHTSAMVPAALRATAGAADERVVACPGLCYRRDVVDRIHVGEPHQLDLWRVRRGEPVESDDLREMIGLIVEAVMPRAEHRAIPAEHPYTEDGLEVEMRTAGGWVELLECGLAGSHVLAAGGLDPTEWSGLALGMGLDRALMLRKGIDDIRLLRSDDPRIASQMLTLEPYRPVSSMPAVRRDLSIAVAAELTAEELGDRVRSALPAEALDAVEEITVLTETPGGDLPPQAIERIGLVDGQKNVLVRLVLRDPSRTLTAEEANVVRDRVYTAVHEGTAWQWAGGSA